MGGVHRRTGRARRSLRASVALAAGMAMLLLTARVTNAAALNMSGTWHANYHCESGWCEGEDFPATDVLTQAEGSNVVTGSNASESISGTISGNIFQYTSTTGQHYVAEGTLTVSPDGLSWTGAVSDNNGTSGTYTATREPTKATVSGQVLDDRDLPAQEVTVKVSGTSDEKTRGLGNGRGVDLRELFDRSAARRIHGHGERRSQRTRTAAS